MRSVDTFTASPWTGVPAKVVVKRDRGMWPTRSASPARLPHSNRARPGSIGPAVGLTTVDRANEHRAMATVWAIVIVLQSLKASRNPGMVHCRLSETLGAATVGPMPTRLVHLVVDAADPAGLARFWSGALEWPVTFEGPDEVVIEPPDDDPAQAGQLP